MNVGFVRGNYNQYNASTYEDDIFFAVDRKVIIVNGVDYGLDAEQAAILEDAVLKVEFTSPGTIKFTQKNGKVITVTIPVASTSTNGLMSKEKFDQVDSNTTRIETLEATAKKQRVTAADKSLTITETEEGTTAKVTLQSNQAVQLNATNGVGLVIDGTDKVLTQSASGLLANLTISKVTTGLEANVKEKYDLVGKNNTVLGSIPVYKDSSLKSAVRDGQAIKFTYILTNGTEEEVKVDLSDFILESEYADGLQVIEGVISVLKDATSESFLTVSNKGIKLSGVQNAIDSAVADLVSDLNVNKIGSDTTIVTSVTQTDGKISATTVAKNATNISSTAVTASATQVGIAGTNVQTNINNIATAIKTEETARIAGDASTLASAKTYTDQCLTWLVL